MNKGMAVCGTVLVDVIKMIDGYPARGMLTGIGEISRATGGLVPNVAMDLAVMDPSIPLMVGGAIGEDENGAFVRATLEGYGLDTAELVTLPGGTTGFTDVMTERGSGARTFFTMDGANRTYVPDEACLDRMAAKADILHIGYIHLMAALDAPDEVYGTRLAGLLHRARARGLKTSVDVVSRPGFEPLLCAALREADYAIMNEIEACGVAGLSPRRPDGWIDLNALKEAAAALLAMGIRDTVIIHCPECGVLGRCAPNGEVRITVVASLDLPAGYMRGSVGAGDAFCAASLYGLWQGWDEEKILTFASAAAACNLASPDAVSGMKCADEIWSISRVYPRKRLPEL